jgi:hypothetical protein
MRPYAKPEADDIGTLQDLVKLRDRFAAAMPYLVDLLQNSDKLRYLASWFGPEFSDQVGNDFDQLLAMVHDLLAQPETVQP